MDPDPSYRAPAAHARLDGRARQHLISSVKHGRPHPARRNVFHVGLTLRAHAHARTHG